MLEVPDQLTEDPGLIGIGNSAVLPLHDRHRQDLGPRQVIEGDLLELPLVDGGRVLPGDRRYLVRDRDQRVVALFAGNVEVHLKLLGLQGVAAGLHLQQRGPLPLATRDPDQTIRKALLLTVLERYFDEGLYGSGRRAE